MLILLALALLLIAGWLTQQARIPPVGQSAESASQPNIVVIMTDDQTVQSLRFLPNVRRLIASAGVTFTNSFVSYPMCCPSRASYLTGQYAHNHHVLFNTPPTGGYGTFKHQGTTFPVALQRAGYRTIHLGKYLNGYGGPGWHIPVPPGWNDFRGLVGIWAYNYYGFRLSVNGTVHMFPKKESDYQTDVLTRLAVAAIARQRTRSQPFFLNVGYLAPHSAGTRDETDMGPEPASVGKGMMSNRLAVPPLRYRGSLKDVPLPLPPSFDERNVSDKPSFMQHLPFFRPFNQTDIAEIVARFHAQIESLRAVDDGVARIISALRQIKQLQRTLVIFTSDNGFFNGEHRIRAGKYFVYEPSVRVPLLMRGPSIPVGVSRRQMVANIDLAPTILAAAHAHPLRVMDGSSLWRIIRAPGAAWRSAILLETGPNKLFPAVYHAVRTSRYLYVEYSTEDRELYDLRRDPDELSNRIKDSRYGPVQKRLAAQLRRLQHCKGSTCRDT